MHIDKLMAAGSHAQIELSFSNPFASRARRTRPSLIRKARVMSVSRWKQPRIIETLLRLTCLIPAMVGYGLVICAVIEADMPSASFLPAKVSLVCFLVVVMGFSCWGGLLACRSVAKRICGG